MALAAASWIEKPRNGVRAFTAPKPVNPAKQSVGGV
jgi:hypothetical protein